MKTALSQMGYKELDTASDLLKAYADGTNAWNSKRDEGCFFRDGLELGFNPNSGYVFLTNADYQTLMLNDNNKLEMWLYCGECGEEGFRSEVQFLDDSTCVKCDKKNKSKGIPMANMKDFDKTFN